MADTDDSQQLLNRITERRRGVEAYLRRARPRSDRLTMVTIISSAIAAVLTAAPAIGGADFVNSISSALELGGPAKVWRPLCLLAMIFSVVAVVSVNLAKSRNAENRIISAETCNAELEGLQTLIEYRQVPLDEAVRMYQQSVAKVPFLRDDSLASQRKEPNDRATHSP
jgi:hypothetical protein